MSNTKTDRLALLRGWAVALQQERNSIGDTLAAYAYSWEAERREAQHETAPIDMILNCPACLQQHIDQPEPGWDNRPHKSHLCHHCDFIWRPADVPTNGVAAIKTRGKNDHVMLDGPVDVLERLRLEQELKNPPKLDWDGEQP